MKGRGNFLCREKVYRMADQPVLKGLDELDWFHQIRDWEKVTDTGDRAELNFLPDDSDLWQRLDARRDACSGSKCPEFNRCFITAMHQRAAEADLIIVNHHLFFADLALKQDDFGSVLPEYGAVIFDEAHEIEDVASEYFGRQISNYRFEELARDAEMAVRITRTGGAGLLKHVARMRERARSFFEAFPAREGRFPFDKSAARGIPRAEPRGVRRAGERAEKPRSGNRLAAVEARRTAEHRAPRHGVARRTELSVRIERRELRLLVRAPGQGRVRRGHADRRQRAAARAPVRAVRDHHPDVGDPGRRRALRFPEAAPRSECGRANACCTSEFDFATQALLYIPAALPDVRDPSFPERAAQEIIRLLEISRGRAFCLFTSYSQMNDLYERVRTRVRFPLLLQGSAPRTALLEKFRNTEGAVLFATSSFWQGVDVRGEQLSCVIVDRLPFAVPSDPIVAARVRALQDDGRNPFAEYQVPEAVLALKQGFGRLIRSRTDRGVLAILDNRIQRMQYGKIFMESLPAYATTRDIAAVERFMQKSNE